MALEHILSDHATMSAAAGLLLDRNWRMHPALCRYTSDAFYDGKLTPHRLNVATLRAKALAIVVASPRLIQASCQTPGQMALVNALRRAWEFAF
jgi:superfamily I DNA and/or RNA helicase